MPAEMPFPRNLHGAALDLDVVERYIAGECTLSERVAIERWIDANPELGLPIRAMQADGVIETFDILPYSRILDVQRRIIGAPSVGEPSPRPLRRPTIAKRSGLTFMPRALPSAAMIAAAVVMAVGTIFLSSRAHSDAWVPGRVYKTAIAQRAVVALPDGSTVTLAPQTTLVLSAIFGQHSRTMSLSGEAYFDVRHSTTTLAPFIVRSGSVSTRVLGTSFDVRRYPRDRETRVVVTHGRVSTGGARAVTVSAGEIGIVSDSTAVLGAIPNATSYTGWVSGRLVFESAPVADVLATLGQWYGVRFILNDTVLASQHVSATFDGTSRVGMLAAIASLLNVTPVLATEHDSTAITLQARRKGVLLPSVRRRGSDSLMTLHTEYGR